MLHSICDMGRMHGQRVEKLWAKGPLMFNIETTSSDPSLDEVRRSWRCMPPSWSWTKRQNLQVLGVDFRMVSGICLVVNRFHRRTGFNGPRPPTEHFMLLWKNSIPNIGMLDSSVESRRCRPVVCQWDVCCMERLVESLRKTNTVLLPRVGSSWWCLVLLIE